MRPLHILPLTAAMLLAASACGAPRSPRDSTRVTTGSAPAVLHVDSYHWSDVTVYAIRDGIRLRLGTVTALGSATFRIPPYLLNLHGELQLEGDPSVGGGKPVRMEPVYIRPGGRAEWTLENGLQRSSIGVW
jgi:hypothetical protein